MKHRSEGLDLLCTEKGSRTVSGEEIAYFIVAISFSKGVILYEQYFGKILGEILTVCFCHATYAIQSESTLLYYYPHYSCLNVKKLHLVCKRTLNYLAKLAKSLMNDDDDDELFLWYG